MKFREPFALRTLTGERPCADAVIVGINDKDNCFRLNQFWGDKDGSTLSREPVRKGAWPPSHKPGRRQPPYLFNML